MHSLIALNIIQHNSRQVLVKVAIVRIIRLILLWVFYIWQYISFFALSKCTYSNSVLSPNKLDKLRARRKKFVH
jgi:hypothetical protein